MRNQAGIEKYAAGTNSSPEHASDFQNREKSNLAPLDSPAPKKKQKPERIKWILEEYKQVMTAFYQALNEPKNNTKRTDEIWRKEAGKHRPYTDTNKLANVRRDIMNKKRLTEAEIEDIKKTVGKQTKTEKPKPEDVVIKMENLTPEQIQNTIKHIRQGKEVHQQNQYPEMEQPQENTRDMPEEKEELDAETKEMKEGILRQIIQIKNIDIEDRQKLCKIRSDKKARKLIDRAKKAAKEIMNEKH